MPNPEVAQMIANGLKTGLPHPGKPELNEDPRLLPLVAFRTAGLPAELREHADNTAVAVGEAIVNLIETQAGSVIIRRTELDGLRAADADETAGQPLPVVCRTCKNPLVYLRVVNGRAMVSAALLGAINTTCPHAMEATS